MEEGNEYANPHWYAPPVVLQHLLFSFRFLRDEPLHRPLDFTGLEYMEQQNTWQATNMVWITDEGITIMKWQGSRKQTRQCNTCQHKSATTYNRPYTIQLAQDIRSIKALEAMMGNQGRMDRTLDAAGDERRPGQANTTQGVSTTSGSYKTNVQGREWQRMSNMIELWVEMKVAKHGWC